MALPLAALLALVALALAVAVAAASAFLKHAASPFLDGASFKPMTLVERVELTHNTRLFRFALDRPSQRLGLPTGQHITFKLRPVGGTDADEDVMKPYTPITDDRTRGTVAFVVKVYPEGRVSRALDAVPVGGRILAKGPRGRFKYERGIATHIGLIAGGTGITPCYQVAAAALSDPADTTAFSLVFANVAEEDILIKKEIDGLVLAHPTRFSVHYVLNSPPLGWTGSVGFVTPDILKKHMPAPGPGVLVARCGPPPMNKAVAAALEGLGYEKNMTFEF